MGRTVWIKKAYNNLKRFAVAQYMRSESFAHKCFELRLGDDDNTRDLFPDLVRHGNHARIIKCPNIVLAAHDLLFDIAPTTQQAHAIPLRFRIIEAGYSAHQRHGALQTLTWIYDVLGDDNYVATGE